MAGILKDAAKEGGISKPLSAKHQLFLLEWIKDMNGPRAAMAAGASEKTAARLASQWLDPKGNYPHVAEAAARLLMEKRERSQIDAGRIVEELTKIALFNPKKLIKLDGTLIELHDLPDEVACAIKEFKVSYKVGIGEDGKPVKVRTVEIKLWDKLEALKQLAQHLGLLKDIKQTINNVMIDWSSLYGRPVNRLDPIEKVISETERLRVENEKAPVPPGLPDRTERAKETTDTPDTSEGE